LITITKDDLDVIEIQLTNSLVIESQGKLNEKEANKISQISLHNVTSII